MQGSSSETRSDKEIIQKLYIENKQKLYYLAWKILRNETDAEEAVHICFLKLTERFERYRKQPYENLVKLCTTIVKHAAADIVREGERKAYFDDGININELDVPDAEPDVLEQLINDYENQRVTEAMMQLPEKERELLALQYELGLKPKEIGELLGVSSAIVRKRMLRSRNKFASILREMEFSWEEHRQQ
ncbi:MAG: sigma-70 family RNA polymerase sigma factor [Lachnospiraceae bacterium]|nr:sigma-70 family RNA polymerase sigma factor [Lachnospiraceae bacterium]